MATAKSVKKLKNHQVSFSIEAPGAKQVMLLGDFNNWDPEAHPMKDTGNGVWEKKMKLAPNQYEYKFLVDGEWKEDPGNEKVCANCFGTLNNVLTLL